MLTSPLGRTCIRKYQTSCDSRAAYLEHERLQKNSRAVFYQSNRLLRKLSSFFIADHKGTRTEYLTDWFNIHGSILDFDEKSISFQSASSFLAEGLVDDYDLARMFEDFLDLTGDDAADMEAIKYRLLQRALMLNGRDANKRITR